MGETETGVERRATGRTLAYWGVLLAAGLFGFLGLAALWLAWYWGVLLFVLACACGAFWLRRARTRSQRVLGIVTLIVLVSWGVFLSTFVRDAIAHDRVRSLVFATVCAEPPALAGSSVLTCDVGPVENPSNGNNCGYEVMLAIETTATSARELAVAYRGGALPVIENLQLVNISIDAPIDGRATIRWLYIGDPGNDLRCN